MKFPVLFLYTHRTGSSININQSRSTICKEGALIYAQAKAAQNALGTSTKEKPSLGLKATHGLHPLPVHPHHQLLYIPVCSGVVLFSIIQQLLMLLR